MDPIACLHPTPKGWLFDGALAPHVDAYVANLRRGRYSGSTANKYIGSIAHFACWMSLCHLPVRMLDEGTVDQFLSDHLPRCDCQEPVARVHGDLRAALGHLLAVLREQQINGVSVTFPLRELRA